jgi:hypothetical protein
MRPLFRDYDMGDGFKIEAMNMRTWTRYTACQQNEAGYVINGRCKEFCRRREANAQIDAWRAQDIPPARSLGRIIYGPEGSGWWEYES